MRTGKIDIENLSGGELTSAPLLSTPPQFSRLLKNFYINSEGHIQKIPGFSAITNPVTNIQISSGIDLRKSDGTSIILVGGQASNLDVLYKKTGSNLEALKSDFTRLGKIYMSQIGDQVLVSNDYDAPVIHDGFTETAVTMPESTATIIFSGTGLNDASVEIGSAAADTYYVGIDGIASTSITPTFTGSGVDDLSVPSPNYTGGAAADFDVAIDSVGSGDTLKYNLNGGAYTTGQAVSDGGTTQYVKSYGSINGYWSSDSALTGATNVEGFLISAASSGNNESNLYYLNLEESAGNYYIRAYINGSQTAYIQAQPDTWYSVGFGFSVRVPSAYFTANARSAYFKFTKQATDASVIQIKAAATTGNNQDKYDIQLLSNASSAGANDFSFRWRKNEGDWETKTVAWTDFPGYVTLDSAFSVRYKAATGNTISNIYSWQTDGASTPDTFKWRKNSEAYTTGVSITAGPMLLKEGIYVEFDTFTGHTNNDLWEFSVTQDTFKHKKGSGSYTTGVAITGALQTIDTGVQVKFSSINGHTLGDQWAIPVSQKLRFGRSHTYKNRVWVVANRTKAYFCVLADPTDFAGDGSGYIDFSYVLPKGDELLDINSFLNYQAFFFRNHIAVYSGSDPTADGDYAIYQIIPDTGVIDEEVTVSVGSDIYFLTSRGIKGLKQILNTGALELNNVSAAIDNEIVDAIAANTSSVYGSAHYPKLGLVMFLIGTTIFVYNYRQNAWSRIVLPSTNNVSKVLTMFSGGEGNMYFGGYDYLHQFHPDSSTRNFAGQPPTYQWTGPMWKITTAESLFLAELVLRLASTSSASLTLKVRSVGFDTGVEDLSDFNEQTLEVSSITTLSNVFNFVRAPLYGAGKYVQIDITETPAPADNNDLEIAGVEISGEVATR